MITFNTSDLNNIQARGITLEEIESQLDSFITGFPFVQLVKPAVPGDGILVLNDDELQTYCSLFEKQSSRYSVIKFVPASGAASRMFKELFSFLEKYKAGATDVDQLLADPQQNSVAQCLESLKKFAFCKDLAEALNKDGFDLNTLIQRKEFDRIISYIILPPGLNYGNLPKALLKFHLYPEGARTALEEHMVEASKYSKDSKDIARIHFTISPEHIDPFLALLNERKAILSQELGVQFDITYSIQKPSTDTLAVDIDNQPFRDERSELVFRPGGHGALIDNLDELIHDIIFIKNIDNIVPDKLKTTTYLYKMALGGLLISLKQQIDNYLDLLIADFPEKELDGLINFCRQELMIKFMDGFDNQTFIEKKTSLYDILNRPLRICGMVKNQGEPGGGPFWIRNNKGNIDLQIVESSQVNLNDHQQKSIFSHSTHFNPVDLVCYVKDHKGQKYSLKNYIDRSTGFISTKSKDGRELKALELPGLWNGAMADWISIFVEVPLITFNPVKVVNDLLRETHQ